MEVRCSDHSEQEVDRLSDLPEPLLLHIFYFLPTRFAVRSSLLSRRFRHLWTSSPSIDLKRSEFPKGRRFIDITNWVFRRRDPSAPLLRLSLETYRRSLPTKTLSKWLTIAHSKGLRHLSLCIHQETIQSMLPLILSFHSLESLSIDNLRNFHCVPYHYQSPSIVPPVFKLIHLKSLHLRARLNSLDLARLVSEQMNLEYLNYETELEVPSILDLSSPTVKILKQDYSQTFHDSRITLSFPILESLDLSMSLCSYLRHFNADMPLLRHACIKIPSLSEDGVCVFGDLLRSLINVEELDLSIEKLYPKENVNHGTSRKRKKERNKNPFHPLVGPGNNLPTYPNLKRLKISMCFYELSIEDAVCFLQNTPVIESLRLVHVADIVSFGERKSYHWLSKLPPNSEGNNEHAYFEDLHLGDKKMQVINKLLCKAIV